MNPFLTWNYAADCPYNLVSIIKAIIMRKHTTRKSDEELQNVSSSSVHPFNTDDPNSILEYIGSIIPSVSNLPENYDALKHLGLDDEKIADVIRGNSAYVYGEISVPRKPRLHTNCGIARISIMKESVSGKFSVHIDAVPLEQYVRNRMQVEKDTAGYLESHTKEELYKRIKSLEEHIATLGEHLAMSEESQKNLRGTIDLLTKALDRSK